MGRSWNCGRRLIQRRHERIAYPRAGGGWSCGNTPCPISRPRCSPGCRHPDALPSWSRATGPAAGHRLRACDTSGDWDHGRPRRIYHNVPMPRFSQ